MASTIQSHQPIVKSVAKAMVVEATTRPELANLVFAIQVGWSAMPKQFCLIFRSPVTRPEFRGAPIVNIRSAISRCLVTRRLQPALLCQIARLKVVTNPDLVAGDRWVTMSQAWSCRQA
jgi:hypothetical protein